MKIEHKEVFISSDNWVLYGDAVGDFQDIHRNDEAASLYISCMLQPLQQDCAETAFKRARFI